jgi:hypothetical protein
MMLITTNIITQAIQTSSITKMIKVSCRHFAKFLIFYPLVIASLICTNELWAQASINTWDRSYKGPGAFHPAGIVQTQDGGFVVVGSVNAGIKVTPDPGEIHHGNWDIKISKYDRSGTPLWNRIFGGMGSDQAQGFIQSYEGGFVIVGQTWSTEDEKPTDLGGGIILSAPKACNLRLINVDANGNKIWDLTFKNKRPYKYTKGVAIVQAQDGGFIAISDLTKSDPLSDDVWIVKVNPAGKVLWDRIFGTNQDQVHAAGISHFSNSEFLVTGRKQRKKEDTLGDSTWVIRCDHNGRILWEDNFKRSKGDAYTGDRISRVRKTKDGGFILVGTAQIDSVNVAWVRKYRYDCQLQWDRIYLIGRSTSGKDIIQSANGSFMVAGSTDSKDKVRPDALIINIDKDGNKLWSESYRGDESTEAVQIVATGDGGYAVAGTEGPFSYQNLWIIKIDSRGEL